MPFNAGKPWILTNLGLNFTSATPHVSYKKLLESEFTYKSNNETSKLKLKRKCNIFALCSTHIQYYIHHSATPSLGPET